MNDFFVILIWIAIAGFCVIIADKKGRSKIVAFIWGILFGLLALVIYALIKGSPEDELKKARIRYNRSQIK